jgi:hypothetical protein
MICIIITQLIRGENFHLQKILPGFISDKYDFTFLQSNIFIVYNWTGSPFHLPW